ncbi:TonB-dependent receptor [Catenovulum sp. SM1970]|uniref:TonB-dependent receptor n=1 Tax=Marinifaba aquimaris TaxID=2741323 RepID=UPI0015740EDD|nr:TonB-dependent receptor [Marinifaba aquimaris]NTS78339.1 TonB-dependent receptor [Marinifaba aquimaris]
MSNMLSKTAVILPLALLSTSGLAQTEGDELFDDLFAEEEIETIQVTGFRSRLKANLDQKRYSESVLDGISAEDIGKFPDKNIADSLQRVTGVSITRDFGEGEKISIRGTAPGLNRTLLNGQNVATADWFVLDNPTRSFNYSLLASEMVSSLEVYKSPQADIDEGSIGGTVVLKTRRPLSVESGTMVGSAQMAYTEKSEEWDPQLSGFYSWHNDNKTFGALISIVTQNRTLRRDGFEVLGYTERDINGTQAYVPDLIGSPYFEQERERNGFMFSAQFKPVDTLLLTFNALHSKLDADNTNHNLLTVPTWEFNPDRNPDGADTSNGVIKDGTLVSWDYGAEDRTGAVLDIAERTSYSETSSFDLDIMYDPGSYQLHFQFGYTEAEGGTTKDTFAEFVAETRQSYDITRKAPQVSFPDIDVNNASVYDQLDWTQIDSKPQKDDETYGQVDYKYYLDHDLFTTIKVGLKFRDHTKEQSKMATRFNNGSDIPGLGLSADQFPAGTLPSDFMDGIAESGSITSYPLVDMDAFERAAYANRDLYSTTESKLDFFEINEEITAVYAMSNFEGEYFRGNVGVRYVQTDMTSTFWNLAGDEFLDSETNDYSEVLPSFNINYDLNEEMLVRFAASKVMSRPEYIQITGARSLNHSTSTGSGGNTQLDPFKANQFDVSYEWYFADTGLFSAAIFYKDIESYIVEETTIEQHYNEISGKIEDFEILLPTNGQGGTNQGLEIGYQQDLWQGWGLLANYTYSDAEADDGSLIPGNSEHTYNATLYFENESLSARVSYNYRTEYFEGYDRGSELMTDGFGQMDGSISYNLTENISLVLQGLNLTDEEIYKYSEVKSRPYSYYSNGRRYFVGAQLSF